MGHARDDTIPQMSCVPGRLSAALKGTWKDRSWKMASWGRTRGRWYRPGVAFPLRLLKSLPIGVPSSPVGRPSEKLSDRNSAFCRQVGGEHTISTEGAEPNLASKSNLIGFPAAAFNTNDQDLDLMTGYRDLLAALRARFSEAAEQFPDYAPAVFTKPSGPRIRRYDVTPVGKRIYWQAFDGGEEAVLLDDPKRLALAEQWVNAFWRFRTLSDELEPVLRQAGVELPAGPNSTSDGRVLFWALGGKCPPRRAAVVPNDNAFFHVSLAIDKLRLDQDSESAKGQSSRANKRNRTRRKPGELNAAFIARMMENPDELRGATARRWARELKATPSQITKLPAWKELKEYRRLQRISRQKAKHQGRGAK